MTQRYFWIRPEIRSTGWAKPTSAGHEKLYGAVKVMHGIDVDIEDGEFVVFVGPSGCGKSTLLRMIAGSEDITSGDVSIGDRLVNEAAQSKRAGWRWCFKPMRCIHI